MLTKIKCPNPECKYEYLYMGYDVPEMTIQKMANMSQIIFFNGIVYTNIRILLI